MIAHRAPRIERHFSLSRSSTHQNANTHFVHTLILIQLKISMMFKGTCLRFEGKENHVKKEHCAVELPRALQ
jgi:hypothetical protein